MLDVVVLVLIAFVAGVAFCYAVVVAGAWNRGGGEVRIQGHAVPLDRPWAWPLIVAVLTIVLPFAAVHDQLRPDSPPWLDNFYEEDPR